MNNTNIDVMPIPLVIFIADICQPKKFVPDNFLSNYQMNRIDTDNYGAFITLDQNQIKMVAGTFLYCRIMIIDILL